MDLEGTLDGTLTGQEIARGGSATVARGDSTASNASRSAIAVALALIGGLALVALVLWVQPTAGVIAGGSARGSGSVTSPPGAYMADPSAAGAATFSLDVSSNDGEAARGHVTFSLPAAGFTFASSSLDRVAVRSEVVEVRGAGTVNGREGYDFSMTADHRERGDGFRLVVWERSSSSIVYDGEPTVPRGYPPSRWARVTEGSIEVH